MLFSELPISGLTSKAVAEMNYTHLAEVRPANPPEF
jgi:hypothetical protein